MAGAHSLPDPQPGRQRWRRAGRGRAGRSAQGPGGGARGGHPGGAAGPGADGDLAGLVEAAGATVSSLPAARLPGALGRAESAARVSALVRDRRPDLVHTTLFDADLVGRVGGWAARVGVVSSLVNVAYGPEQRANPAITPWKLDVVRRADRAVGPGRAPLPCPVAPCGRRDGAPPRHRARPDRRDPAGTRRGHVGHGRPGSAGPGARRAGDRAGPGPGAGRGPPRVPEGPGRAGGGLAGHPSGPPGRPAAASAGRRGAQTERAGAAGGRPGARRRHRLVGSARRRGRPAGGLRRVRDGVAVGGLRLHPGGGHGARRQRGGLRRGADPRGGRDGLGPPGATR